MNIQKFLDHHHLTDNPFDAEEARHDRVFDRMMDQTGPYHPDFNKIMGKLDPPSTAIVFGEKGSGKTAIRLLIASQVKAHNLKHPTKPTMLVIYDDLNPYLDRVLARHQMADKHLGLEQRLEKFRLEDHQDAILSLAVTQLVDTLLDKPALNVLGLAERVKVMPSHTRADVALLASLYDHPASGSLLARWWRLLSRLKMARLLPISLTRLTALVLTACAAALCAYYFFAAQLLDADGVSSDSVAQQAASSLVPSSDPSWALALAGVLAAGAGALWLVWLGRHAQYWVQAGKLVREMPALNHRQADLRAKLISLGPSKLDTRLWPIDESHAGNNRYELTGRLMAVLHYLGYAGLLVIIDRVDEPTAISGHGDRMQSVTWPMMDNKFLQQDSIGIKMLLPIELRHALHRQESDFFQEARLDKQNLIDPLTWSGATLYDLCTDRLRHCCSVHDQTPISLTDLFETDVSREMLIEALNQMHQPRDAFKFIYCLINEHCNLAPADQARFKIAKLTLDAVRKTQSDRLQSLYRGLTPG